MLPGLLMGCDNGKEAPMESDGETALIETDVEEDNQEENSEEAESIEPTEVEESETSCLTKDDITINETFSDDTDGGHAILADGVTAE